MMGIQEWAYLDIKSIYENMVISQYVYYSSHRNEIRLYLFKRNIPKSFVYIGDL